MSVFKRARSSNNSLIKTLAIPLLIGPLLAACGSDNDDMNVMPTPDPEPMPMESSFDITIANLTHGQPLSPIAVTLHGDSTMWKIGEPSSQALEMLAEGGDNSSFMAIDGVLASQSTDGPVGPGSSATISVSTTDVLATHLSVATMLVNTNDAFSGLTGLELATLVVDSPKSWRLNVYDSGTEANSESVGTIPGPADGGTGFDAMRDDVDVVAMHPGVVSSDDGLTNSVLTQAHRFDNPSIKLTITRTK